MSKRNNRPDTAWHAIPMFLSFLVGAIGGALSVIIKALSIFMRR